MADRELTITLRFAAQAAERAAEQYHQRERQRIQEDAKEQDKADKAYVRSMKLKARAGKDLEKQIQDRAKAEARAIKESEDAYVKAVKKKLQAEKQLEQQRLRTEKEIAATWSKYHRDREAAEAKAAAQSEKAYIKAVQGKLRAEKQLEQAELARVRKEDAEFREAINRKVRGYRALAAHEKRDADARARDERDHQDLVHRGAVERNRQLERDLQRSVAQSRAANRQMQEDASRRIREEAAERLASERRVMRDIARYRRALGRMHPSAEAEPDSRWEARTRKALDSAAAETARIQESGNRAVARDIEQAQWEGRLEAARAGAREYGALATETAEKSVNLSRRAAKEAQAVAKATTKTEKEELSKRAKATLEQSHELSKIAKDQANTSAEYAKEATRAAKKATTDNYEFSKQAYKKIAEEATDDAKMAAKNVKFANDEVKKSAKETTDSIRAGMKGASDATEDATEKTMGFAKAFVTLHYAERVARGVEMAMKAVADSASDAHKTIEGMVEKMETLRERSAEILAMRGDRQTGMATATLAKEAAEASVTTDTYLSFTEEFQATAQEFIGEEKHHRLNQEQASRLSKEFLTYATSQGVKPDAAAALAGIVIRRTPVGKDGKIDEEKARSNYAKLLGTMQLAPGRTSPLMPQFAEVASEMVGEGADYKDILDAAMVFRVATEVNPKHGSAIARAITRGLRQIRQSEVKMAELGITKGMTTEEGLMQAQKRIEEIAKQEGVSENDVIGRYFNEIREFSGFRAFVNEGVRGGMFDRARAQMARSGIPAMQAANAEYRRSPRGVTNRQKAERDRVELERASQYENLMVYRRNAVNTVIAQGKPEETEGLYDALMTKKGEEFGMGGKAESEALALESADLVRDLRQLAAQGSTPAADFLESPEGRKLAALPRELQPMARMHAANLIVNERNRMASRGHGGKTQSAMRRRAFDRMKRDNPAVFGDYENYEDFNRRAPKTHRHVIDDAATQMQMQPAPERAPHRVVLPPALPAAAGFGQMGGFDDLLMRKPTDPTMHHVDHGAVGDWFVDEHGKLRHSPKQRAVPLDEMRKMPVTWTVKGNNADLRRGKFARKDAASHGYQSYVSRKKAAAAAPSVRQTMRPVGTEPDVFAKFRQQQASGKTWQYYMQREQLLDAAGDVGTPGTPTTSRDPMGGYGRGSSGGHNGDIASAARDLKAAAVALKGNVPAPLPSAPQVMRN